MDVNAVTPKAAPVETEKKAAPVHSNTAKRDRPKSPQQVQEIANPLDSSVSTEFIERTLDQINKSISFYNREMRISVHEKTQRIMVKVMDTDNHTVIREIPPEKVLDSFAQTLQLAGILLDKMK